MPGDRWKAILDNEANTLALENYDASLRSCGTSSASRPGPCVMEGTNVNRASKDPLLGKGGDRGGSVKQSRRIVLEIDRTTPCPSFAKEGFAQDAHWRFCLTVGAVSHRAFFLESTKNAPETPRLQSVRSRIRFVVQSRQGVSRTVLLASSITVRK